MQTTDHSPSSVVSSQLAQLAMGQLGSVERSEVLDVLVANQSAARELQLLLALEDASMALSSGVAATQSNASSRRWRMLLPLGAAALMLAMWPQREPLPTHDVATVASSDVLFSVSFEATNDRFSGGFE